MASLKAEMVQPSLSLAKCSMRVRKKQAMVLTQGKIELTPTVAGSGASRRLRGAWVEERPGNHGM